MDRFTGILGILAILLITYDASHRVTQVLDQRGIHLLANSYDSTGRVVAQTRDPAIANPVGRGSAAHVRVYRPANTCRIYL